MPDQNCLFSNAWRFHLCVRDRAQGGARAWGPRQGVQSHQKTSLHSA
jgi:hypothetical protein